MKDQNKGLWNRLQKEKAKERKKTERVRKFSKRQPSDAKFHSVSGGVMDILEE